MICTPIAETFSNFNHVNCELYIFFSPQGILVSECSEMSLQKKHNGFNDDHLEVLLKHGTSFFPSKNCLVMMTESEQFCLRPLNT